MAVVSLATVLILFTRLGAAGLWDEDESRNAACAREMLESGNWLVPTFNYERRDHKPILLYWLMMSAYQAFGITEFAARCWSAVLGCGTVWLVYRIGCLLFDEVVAAWSAIILVSSLMFAVLARAATPDATLIFWLTVSLYAFIRGLHRARRPSARDDSPVDQRSGRAAADFGWRPARLDMSVCYGAMGLAVLTKGPIGVLLPTLAFTLFFFCMRRSAAPRSTSHAPSAREAPGENGITRAVAVWRWMWAPRDWCRALAAVQPALGVAVVGLLSGPWYLRVAFETDGAWLSGFLGTHNLGRYLSPMEGHSGPVVYYAGALLAGFLPWSVFLPGALLHGVRNASRDGPRRAACVLLLSWIVTFVAFFSFSATKLPNYVAPVLPALALLTASLLVEWQREQSPFAVRWFRIAMAALVVVGAGVGMGSAVALSMVCPGAGNLGWISVLLLAGGSAGSWLARAGWLRIASLATAGACVAWATALLSFGAVRVSEHQDGRILVAQARTCAGGRSPQLLAYGVSMSSLVFYSRSQVGYLQTPVQVDSVWTRNPDALLVTRSDLLGAVNEAVGGSVVVCSRCRRFLRREELLLLRHPDAQLRVAGRAVEQTD